MCKLLMLGMVLLVAGCATGGGENIGAPTIDVTGTWTGSFVNIGSTGTSFPFVAVLEQKGNTVTGTISGASAAYNGPIQGRMNGNNFSWRQISGAASGDLVVSGHEMSGKGTGGGAGYPGRLTLRRSP